ncbi:uncharacterized protein LOC119613826 [Lucilia sericata]|uniref:uncharacterized protein LOC119613826 n=1 Tax=Lucilia sericata TaxID=13632 RepID=UPI0018A83DDC|nr:uncharacterized protein LOC119613826 [Lucilia sericata]
MQKIQWHFSPPAAPHFGGIWEAGVKSVKYHLKRTIGEAKLTYEEMSTLLIQIEAVLNSRPLVALNNDEPGQFDALTPGHFLIGRPLNACAELVEEANINSLNRWKLIQKLRKDFWVRWKQEYLTTLQQRNKWKFPSENLKEGTVVLIKDENTHPASWPLARITEVHSGKDGKVRVATLKLANSSLKRPISKLCPLVSTDTEEQNSAPAMSCVTTTKPEKKKLCWLQFILMMLMIMNPVKALPINMNNVVSISNLSANTALYLDKVGQLNAINSKWNLVVYYDLSLYYQELERIGKLMGKVREECPKLNLFKDSCEMVMTSRSSDKNFSSKMHINSVVYVTHKPYVRVNNEA